MLNLPLETDPFKNQQFDKAIEAITDGDHRKAIMHLTNSITISDNNAILYLHRGSCYYKLKNYILAKHDLETGIEMIKIFVRENRGLGTETLDTVITQIIQALVLCGTIAREEKRFRDAFNDYTEAIGFNYMMVYHEVLPPDLKVSQLFMRRAQLQALLYRMPQAYRDMGYAIAEASGTEENEIIRMAKLTGQWDEIEQACKTFSKVHPPDRWEYIKRNTQ